MQGGRVVGTRDAAALHAAAVEATEGAVVLLPPPAAARGFQGDVRLDVRADGAGGKLREVVVVVRDRETVHVEHHRGADVVTHQVWLAARQDAREASHRRARQEPSDQHGEHPVPFS